MQQSATKSLRILGLALAELALEPALSCLADPSWADMEAPMVPTLERIHYQISVLLNLLLGGFFICPVACVAVTASGGHGESTTNVLWPPLHHCSPHSGTNRRHTTSLKLYTINIKS